MRQDDAVEAPVGAEVEEHELVIGSRLEQRRFDVLVRVGALVVRPLGLRRGVCAKRECHEGGQRDSLHTGLPDAICGTAATLAQPRRDRGKPCAAATDIYPDWRFKGFRYPRALPWPARRRGCPPAPSRGLPRR